MRNITPQQEKLVDQLQTLDPTLVVRWDEVRGVASSVRGKLWNISEHKGEKAAELTQEEALKNFLQEYAALFGPSDLPSSALKILRQNKDNLGWTHLILQHMLQKEKETETQWEEIEIYGAKLSAHFDAQDTLVEVQSSIWRDISIDAAVNITSNELVELLLKRLEDVQGFAELRERLGGVEKYFPLTDPPRLVVYPWMGGFPLAWAAYGYGVIEGEWEGTPKWHTKITFGQLFVDASTGEQILFAPTLQDAETPDTGTGLAVTPLTGVHTSRSLNIVRVDATSTYRLKDTTHNRDIVTFDPACSTLYNSDSEIETAISGDTLPVSEDTDGDKDWNRLPTDTTLAQRTSGQQPEVDAHFFARQQYEWYDALAGGRDGWDDGNYSNPPVPAQTINVLSHCYPPPPWGGNCSMINAYKWCRKSGGIWTYWLAFMDGDGTTYDYPAGSHFIFAHEYQHAITDFSFEDGAGDPGLTYSGWLGAVHEGLSDVFGGLSSEQWLPATDISHAAPPEVFRNIVYPRDTTAYDSNKLDHFADRNILTSFYERGTILAHCAYLIGKGGVHQRATRIPVLIPVYSIGMETIGGKSVLKAARIWYRALSYYFSTHGALTGIPTNDEDTFRTLRDGCVSAAIDIYGSGSAEHRNTILAFYAVGLHPTGESYGADVTFLRWGRDWDLSRNYVGLTSPNYSSLDLFINNGGTSEWNALINVVDLSGIPTEYENTVYCRVRNVGDQSANDVQVQFFYAKFATSMGAWLPVTDKNGIVQTLNIGTLTAGQSNFPDSDQNTPPAAASVKWCIPPLAIGEVVDHFCLRAEVTSSNDVNAYNNEVQTNVGYAAYSPAAPFKSAFMVGNPNKEKEIPIELKVETALPRGWRAYIVEDFNDRWLKPGEERLFTVAVEVTPGADARLEMPLDGDIYGQLYGDMSGPFTGSLTGTVLKGQALQGLFSGSLPHIGAVVGMFDGTIDLDTGQVKGKVLGSHPCKVVDRICVSVEACLRPWRRVDVSQWQGTDHIGGITVQVQVPWEKGPCILKLPPTDTEVTPETPTPGPGELVKGKIARLLYDGCGDFTGFVLNLCPGEQSFQSHEPKVERLVREACENRWSVTIVPSVQDASYISDIQVHC